MFEEKDIKIPTITMDNTPGLSSALQLVDSTANEMFATVNNNTSDDPCIRITYSPVVLPEELQNRYRVP